MEAGIHRSRNHARHCAVAATVAVSPIAALAHRPRQLFDYLPSPMLRNNTCHPSAPRPTAAPAGKNNAQAFFAVSLPAHTSPEKLDVRLHQHIDVQMKASYLPHVGGRRQ